MKVRVFSENGWTKGVIIKRRSGLYEWMTSSGWGCGAPSPCADCSEHYGN